jgi:hypothetical protein
MDAECRFPVCEEVAVDVASTVLNEPDILPIVLLVLNRGSHAIEIGTQSGLQLGNLRGLRREEILYILWSLTGAPAHPHRQAECTTRY